jgi:hypothetical protein
VSAWFSVCVVYLEIVLDEILSKEQVWVRCCLCVLYILRLF